MSARDRKILLSCALALIAVLYLNGRLDTVLYHVGLNQTPCGQNAYGAVYCGNALTEYNERVHGVEQTALHACEKAAEYASECR